MYEFDNSPIFEPLNTGLVSADWIQLGETFYSKHTIYNLDQFELNFDHYKVVIGKGMGLIAMVRDTTKLIQSSSTQHQLSTQIQIYTLSGVLINRIKWDKLRLMGLGWTNEDSLACVFEDGTVNIYELFGEFKTFSLGLTNGVRVAEVKFWDTGLIALTSDSKFVYIEDYSQPLAQTLNFHPTEGDDTIHSWCLIPPELSLSKHVEVLLATKNTVIALDSQAANDQLLQQGPFIHIELSPNGKLLCLITFDCQALVVSSDFHKKYLEQDLSSLESVLKLAWCGNDLLLLHTPESTTMLGPFGDFTQLFFDGHTVHFSTESDGILIISQSGVDFLTKLDSSTESLFGIGSTSPSAMLYEALDHFNKKSPKADENIRNIGNKLESAVNSCIEAAGQQWSVDLQKQLLKAASFGKSFLYEFNPSPFIEMATTLRVLNCLRHPSVGLPLTLHQYKNVLGPQKVLKRLLSLRKHLLAIKVCEHLKWKTDDVIIDWACTKIRCSIEDEEATSRIILNKIGDDKPGLAYHQVAKVANEMGLYKLAIKLLDREPKTSRQIPMLLNMNQDGLALQKAILSGDPNLVYLVLQMLQRKLPLGDFFQILSKFPVASSLFELNVKNQDPQLLKDFYYQEDRGLDRVIFDIQQTYGSKSVEEVIEVWKDGSKRFGGVKELGNSGQLMEEQIALLKIQSELETKTRQPFVGLSLSDTVILAAKLDDQNTVNLLKSNFNISDKRFWWLKLKGLVQARNWEGLEQFSKTKKSPIGYLPFYKACVTAKQPNQAMRYVPKCDAQLRPKLFLNIKAYREAGQEAFNLKDSNMLRTIRQNCQDNLICQELDVLLVQLNQ